MVTVLPPPTDRNATLDVTAELFRGLADASRLAIVAGLRDGERCVSDLVEATGLGQTNVPGHLTCLKDCGLVVSRRNGRLVYYRLADPHVEAAFSAADVVLMRHADRIAACINYRAGGEDREAADDGEDVHPQEQTGARQEAADEGTRHRDRPSGGSCEHRTTVLRGQRRTDSPVGRRVLRYDGLTEP